MSANSFLNQDPYYVAITSTPPQYAAKRLLLSHGKGVHLFDKKGNKYLDFGAGIAVNALGYGLKDLAKIASTQMKKLIHVSNLYANEPMLALSEKLVSLPIAQRKFQTVHFGNSGTEANEAALKYARAYAKKVKGPASYEIISFDNSFHGRTLGALSTSNQKKYREKFEPLLPACISLPYNDTAGLHKAINERTAAIIVEAVQGEGGLSSVTGEFADALNKLAEAYDAVLIVDEIQTGLGRCAKLVVSDHLGLKADIITLAKPLAAGLPLSATLLSEKITSHIEFGDHGSTFGGGPVTSAVALAVINKISTPAFLDTLERKSKLLDTLLQQFLSTGYVKELRGIGMLRGLVLDTSISTSALIHYAAKKGLLVLRSGEHVIRIAPPLIISDTLLRKGISILEHSLERCAKDSI